MWHITCQSGRQRLAKIVNLCVSFFFGFDSKSANLGHNAVKIANFHTKKQLWKLATLAALPCELAAKKVS